MQKEKHPSYIESRVTCISCGNSFSTHSISKEIKVDVCYNCHPFYNGKISTASKAGRIDRFNKRQAKVKK